MTVRSIVVAFGLLGTLRNANAIDQGWRVLPGKTGAVGTVKQHDATFRPAEEVSGYLLVERIVRLAQPTGLLPASNYPAKYGGFGITQDSNDSPESALEVVFPQPLHTLPMVDMSQHSQLQVMADMMGGLLPTQQTLAHHAQVQSLRQPDSGAQWSRSEHIGRGKQGEVWKATKLGDPKTIYALKRIFNASGDLEARQQGLREAHFGLKLKGVKGCSQYVEHFWTGKQGEPRALWIAFRYHGSSISNLLYDVSETGLLKPSKFWKSLHSHEDGAAIFKNITGQIIHAVAAAHQRGIVHRDIKPSNILLMSDARGAVTVTVADWSSAIDTAHQSLLYGREGPSVSQQTMEYAPPETRMTNGSIPFAHAFPESYDSWSIGATLLELALAARPSQWLAVSRREEIQLRRSMHVTSDLETLTAMTLIVFRQWCLWGLPHANQVSDGESASSVPCPSFQGFQQRFVFVANEQLKNQGMTEDHLVEELGQDLLFWLLLFDPSHRLSVSDATTHPFLETPN
jgi:serine/threonine protein kinase